MRLSILLLPSLVACVEPVPATQKSGGVDTSTPADTEDTDVDEDTDSDEDTDEETTDDTASPDDTGDTEEEEGPLTALECFAGQLPADGVPLVDYDQFTPVMGSHCKGTDHQDIAGIERVVFAGDSITVGTPPTPDADWYRNVMADSLASQYGLESPSWLWSGVDPFSGVSWETFSGDFANCSKWGARTDDISRAPHEQLQTCMPESEREKTTLVVMTVGGNDLFTWAQDLRDGMTEEEVWAAAEAAVADMESSIHWLVDDPSLFPNGVYVVFANTFDFSDVDAAQDLSTCPGADLIGMDTGLVDPTFMAAAAWMMEEYMRIAVETGTDMVFMGEHTCGHGHMRDEATGRCYRGPSADLWFDVTCMHPSSEGHAGIADLFLETIAE